MRSDERMKPDKATRLAKIRSGTCTYPGCKRRALRGWTTCPRHYTGGRGLKKNERKEI
jgi:hypothetical protein